MDPTFYASYFRHETTHWWFRWRFDLISDVLGGLPQDGRLRILDAGCGTGQMLKCLESHGEAIGIDSSSQAVGYAQERGVRRLVRGSITDPPFRGGSFDCVVALDVIEHVDDDVGILTKLHEVVKPGGHLIVTVPAFRTLWSEHDEINQHKRRYRAGQLAHLIEEAGFDLQRVSYCNTTLFLPVLAMRKAKNLLRSVRRARGRTAGALRSDLDEYPAPVNAALAWVMRGETRLMRRVDLPFGVSILAVARRPVAAASASRAATTSGSAGWAPAPAPTASTAVGAANGLHGAFTPASAEVGDEAAVL
ncbi:MAG TPA: class I SAM-dependent methyltransferase [Thermomicrobiales bacterium]|jgi:SAM-dependent methyltransferase